MTMLADAPKPLDVLPNLGRTHVVGLIGKGGAGKSTCATNLATTAVKLGFRAAILDIDPQASSTLWRSLRPDRDVWLARPNTFEQVQLAILKATAARFHFLFVDTPAAAAGLARDILHLTNQTLIISRPTTFDANVTRDHIRYCESIEIPWHVVLNACPPVRERIEAPVVREFREIFQDYGNKIWRGQITETQLIPYSIAAGQAVIEISPDRKAAREFAALLKAVVKFARYTELV